MRVGSHTARRLNSFRRQSRSPHAGPICRSSPSTFGLISEGKGIEVAIRALADIVADHPDVVYLIAGQTHPEVAMKHGEQYRLSLEELVRELALTDHVRFGIISERARTGRSLGGDRHLPHAVPRLGTIVSGRCFAVVAAARSCRPVLLRGGPAEIRCGGVGPFRRSPGPRPCRVRPAGRPGQDGRNGCAGATGGRRSRLAGGRPAAPSTFWTTPFGKGHVARTGRAVTGPNNASDRPRIRTDHLFTLVDETGIIQHADGVIPARATGYCVDDVARLVIVALGLGRAAGLDRERAFDRMVTSGLSFLRDAWVPERAAMHNFLSYNRSWINQPCSGDHVGRTVWALGSIVAARPNDAIGEASLQFLQDMAPAMDRMASLREIAFAVLGVCRTPPAMLPLELANRLEQLAGRLLDAYSVTADDDWRWFENTLTYDNARLPQALLAAGERLSNQKMIDAGVASFEWYGEQCTLDGPAVRLPRNSWRHRGEIIRSCDQGGRADEAGDEQPLDAAALVECCVEALEVTGISGYGFRAVRAFEWFLGRNRLRLPVYDDRTGGCHDGLGPWGVNTNQGAESTLAYFQAVLALQSAGLHRTGRPLRPGTR